MMTTKIISIEGTSLGESELTQFANAYPECQLVEIRHMGAEPFTLKLLIMAGLVILPKIARLYVKLKEIDSKCRIKIGALEIEGIRSAKDISDIVKALQDELKND